MLTRAIPSSDRRIPVIGLGTNNYGVSTPEELAPRKAVLQRLASVGNAVIDTAPAYGRSEATLGELLSELGNRDRFFVATKVTAEANAAEGRAMIEESLARLRTKHLDLVQVHNLNGVDLLLPLLTELKQGGRVAHIGITTSRSSAHARLAEFMRKHPLDFIQVDYSLGNRAAADEVLPLALERKQAVLVNLPLGGRRGGSLFAKVSERALPEWAAEFDARSWAQFFLKYCLSHPAVTCVIPGTTKLEHIEDNLRAGAGALPDAALRKRMEAYWDSIP